MTLRRKLLLMASLTVLALVVLLQLVSRAVLLRQFQQLEQAEVIDGLVRAHNVLDFEVLSLQQKSADYAAWDDTYHFISSPTKVYIDSNFMDSTFEILNVQFVALYDASGKLVFKKRYDSQQKKEGEFPAGLQDALESHDGKLIRASGVNDEKSGLIRLSTGPAMITALPIITSNREGPVRGTLIFGRFLDKSALSRLSSIAHEPVDIRSVENSRLPDDFKMFIERGGKVPLVLPKSEKLVSGYMMQKDIFGDNAFVIRVDLDRDVYRHGRAVINQLLLLLAGFGILFGALGALLIERSILSRLAQVSVELGRIGMFGDLGSRISIKGKDELSQLAVPINQMLHDLENAGRQREAILNNIPDIAWMKDRESRYIAINETFEKKCGRKSRELVGKTDLDVFPMDLAERYRADDREVIASGRRKCVDEPFADKDGNVTIIATIKTPIFDDKGEVIGTTGIARDITERHEMEKKLREAEQRYRAIVEDQTEMICRYKLDGTITFVNEAYCRLWEKTSEELVGTRMSDLIDEPDKKKGFEDHLRCLAKLTRENPIRLGESEDIGPDGQPRWQQWVDRALFGEEGIVEIQAVGRDITGQKLAEAKLREAEQRYRAVLEDQTEMICRFKSDGTVVFANAAYCRFLGKTVEEVLGRKYEPVIHPDDLEGVHERLSKLTPGNPIVVIENRIVLRGGEIRWTQWTNHALFTPEGQLHEYQAVGKDITERRHAERLAAVQHAIPPVLAESTTEQEVVERILQAVVGNLGWSLGEFWQVDAVLNRLTCSNIHAADGVQADEFIEVSRKMTFEPGAGLPGRVWADGQPHWIMDVLKDDNFPRAPHAEKAGFHTAFAFPIRKSGKIAGVMEFFTRELHPSDEGLLRLFWGIGIQIGQFMERHDAVEALRLSELRYRSLVDNIPDVTWRSTRDGRTLFISPTIEKVMGFSVQDYMRKGETYWFGRIHPEDLRHVRDAYEALFKDKRAYDIEYQIQRSDGKWIWVHDRALATGVENGVEYADGIFSEITQRKLAEEELVRLSSAIENAAEAVVVTDLDANIQYVNPAFERVSGYLKAEVLGKNPRILKSGKHGELYYKKMWETLQAGKTWMGEFVNKRKDGTIFHEEGSISPLRTPSGKVIGYVAVKRDVTKQMQLESELRQAQKMEAIGQLAGGIAHDFNNMLASIMGYAKLGIDDAPEGSELRDDLQQILKAGKRGKELVEQMLSFSRQSGIRGQVTPQQLGEIVREAMKLLRPSLPSNILIDLKLPDGLPFVLIDPIEYHQVIVNLCINASQAMPNGGRLLVELESHWITRADEEALKDNLLGEELHPGKYVVLTVQDNGCGIPKAILPRVFEPFFTTRKKGQGTGMGLAVVYGIVKNHHGAIHAYSEEGQGTTMRVYLPTSETTPIVKPVEKSGVTTGTESLLIVDDEEPLAKMIGKTLKRLGYSVEVKTSSPEALEAFRRNPDSFDLIISDQTMPGLTGDKLAEEIRKIRPEVPIILCSGFSEILTPEREREIKVSKLVRKPFVGDELEAEIRRLLDARKTKQG